MIYCPEKLPLKILHDFEKKNLSSTSFELYAPPPPMIFGACVELGLKVVGVLVRCVSSRIYRSLVSWRSQDGGHWVRMWGMVCYGGVGGRVSELLPNGIVDTTHYKHEYSVLGLRSQSGLSEF